jgi:YVTN family beta-propeller protein
MLHLSYPTRMNSLNRDLRPLDDSPQKSELFRVFMFLTLAMVLLSCNSQDRIIDTRDGTWRVFSATQDSGLSIISQPKNILSIADAFQSINKRKLEAPITQIREFGTNLYLILPSAKKIEVINSDTYTSVGTINMAPPSLTPRTPVDLCFANGTTAYCANDDSTVSPIDITVFSRVTNDIIVGKRPSSISCIDNVVCVANQESNTVSLIRTQTNRVEKTLPAGIAPRFVVSNTSDRNFGVVCRGAGKFSSGDKTPATVYTYSSRTLESMGSPIQLVASNTPANDVDPTSATVTPSGLVYIPIQGEICVADIKNIVYFGSGGIGSFTMCQYNSRRDEIAFSSSASGEFMILNALDATEVLRVQLPVKPYSFFVF